MEKSSSLIVISSDLIIMKASNKYIKYSTLKINIDLELLRYKHAIYIDILVLKILLNIHLHAWYKKL